jgi:hypothetical protein
MSEISPSPLETALTAFSIVLVAMFLLSTALFLLRLLVPKPRAGAAAAAPAVASESDEDEDPELLAVLSAAASEALGAPARLYRVHIHREQGERWSRAGRMDIMISHRVEPKR